MCKTCGESIDHLFLQCKVVTELWSALLQLFCVVGYASKGEQVVGELEGANGQSYVGADLENGSIVFDVVSMEGTKCTQF
jgi:hypothetical protein